MIFMILDDFDNFGLFSNMFKNKPFRSWNRIIGLGLHSRLNHGGHRYEKHELAYILDSIMEVIGIRGISWPTVWAPS